MNFPANLFFKIHCCPNTLLFTKPISLIPDFQLNQPAKLVVLVKVGLGISVRIDFFSKKELSGINKISYNQQSKKKFYFCASTYCISNFFSKFLLVEWMYSIFQQRIHSAMHSIGNLYFHFCLLNSCFLQVFLNDVFFAFGRRDDLFSFSLKLLKCLCTWNIWFLATSHGIIELQILHKALILE